MARANGSPMTKIVRERKMCIRMYVYMYVRLYVCCITVRLYVSMYVCMYAYVRACVSALVYMCETKGKRERERRELIIVARDEESSCAFLQ
jgi:hypothetical protein